MTKITLVLLYKISERKIKTEWNIKNNQLLRLNIYKHDIKRCRIKTLMFCTLKAQISTSILKKI